MNGHNYKPKMTDRDFDRYKCRMILLLLFFGVTVFVWGTVILIDILSWAAR